MCRDRLLPFSLALFILAQGISGGAAADEAVEVWSLEFLQLREAMSSGYANLEHSWRSGIVNPIELTRSTERKLRSASSVGEARKAILEFIDAFSDPHLRAERRAERPRAAAGSESHDAGIDPQLRGKRAVAAMGYRKRKLGFGVKVDALPGFKRLDDDGNPFAAGVLPVDDRRYGFIRIAHFGEDGYPATASRVWGEFAQGLDAPCDARCRYAFQIQVANRLLDALARQVRRLSEAQIDALIVDVTGNGGGTDWAEIAPRLLASRELECRGAAFVKHPHWSDRLERQSSQLEQDRQREGLPPELGEALEVAASRLEALLEQSRRSCDWMPIWSDDHFVPACSRLVRPSSCLLPAGRLPAGLRELPSASFVDGRLQFDFEPGVYDGKLIVVMDRGTASAAEQFVTLLQANDAAVVIGSRSHGAGCGYTYGGISVYLESLQLLVRMPDCARYDARGINELAGLVPDIPVPWEKGDSGTVRARKMVDVLPAAMAAPNQ